MVDGHDKDDVQDKTEGVDEMKVEDAITFPDNGTKKIIRKRKQKAEDSPVSTVSTPPKLVKRNTDAVKMKEAIACNDSSNDNEKGEAKDDRKVESPAMTVIHEDEVCKGDGKDLEVGNNVKGSSSNKKGTVAKKKVDAKAKGGITNDESDPTKSAMEEELNLKVDENLTSVATNIVPAVEKMDVEGIKDDANETENIEVASDGMLNVTKKDKNKAAIISTSSIDADKSKNPDKRSSSATEKRLKKSDGAEKGLKKIDGMGLIFMCNAKTKKDCYKYNIFGLPESKKDLVAKVYKGMRLFLYDVDLKLMYGIYKAASRGGYNIEQKAFNAKFPSQVSFTVLRDCLPLPEDKFKAAIKENYYRRHMFNCQLSPEQVRKLCKLFQSAGKAPEKNRSTLAQKRKRHFDVYASEAIQSPRRADYRPPRRRTHSTKDDFYAREAYRSPPPQAAYRSSRFPMGDEIHARAAYLSPPRAHYRSPPPKIHRLDDDIRIREPYLSPPPPRYPYLSPPRVHPINDDIYAREVYLTPHPRASYRSPPPLSVPLPTLSGAYPQPPLPSDSFYGRDRQRILDPGTRLPRDAPVAYQDSYTLHGEPPSYLGTLHSEHARRILPPRY